MTQPITCVKCSGKFSSRLIQKDFDGICPACLFQFTLDAKEETPKPPLVQTLAPGFRLGQYQILQTLGAGGMGVVYQARHINLGRTCALKLLSRGFSEDREFNERFIREAQIASNLTHPHIVQIYELNKTTQGYFIAMQFVEGRHLEDYCPGGVRHSSVTLSQLLGLVKEVAEAVHFAHQHGVIHRDLKPANILIKETIGQDSRLNLTPYITDFGLAKSIRTTDRRISASGILLGTPTYMSPEQAEGTHQLDARSDVYSLGATLYEVVTGRPPFHGKNPMDIAFKVINQEPKSPRKFNPKLPKEIEVIILKALDKKPHRRYATAQEFAEDLRRFLEHEPIRAKPASLTYRLVKKVQKHPALAAALFLLVLTIIGATILWRTQVTYTSQSINVLEIINDLSLKMATTKAEFYKTGNDATLLRKEMQDRLNEISQFIDTHPGVAEGYYLRAQGQVYLMDYAGAEIDLNKAVNIKPDLNSAWTLLTRIYLEQFAMEVTYQQRKDYLNDLFKKVTATVAKAKRTPSKQGLKKTEDELVNETLVEVFRTFYLNPFDFSRKARGKLETALKDIKSEVYYNWLGILSSSTREKIDYYQKAVARMPAYAKGHYDLGYSYYEVGEWKRAISEWEEVIKLNPTFGQELEPRIKEAREKSAKLK